MELRPDRPGSGAVMGGDISAVDGETAWHWPLTPEGVNRLARVAYRTHHGRDQWDESRGLHEHWENVIRAIFAELMATPLRENG